MLQSNYDVRPLPVDPPLWQSCLDRGQLTLGNVERVTEIRAPLAVRLIRRDQGSNTFQIIHILDVLCEPSCGFLGDP